MTFPTAGSSIYYNDAGEPLGWDNHRPDYDDPGDYDPGDFDPYDEDDDEGDDEDDGYDGDEEPERCEADARRGTGTGVCLSPLDTNGNCGRASEHLG